jgi:hypothetical protein
MEVSGQLHAPAALPPGQEPLVPIGQEAGWAPEPFWTRWWKEKFPAPAGNRTLEPRPSSPWPSRYYDWATLIVSKFWGAQTFTTINFLSLSFNKINNKLDFDRHEPQWNSLENLSMQILSTTDNWNPFTSSKSFMMRAGNSYMLRK